MWSYLWWVYCRFKIKLVILLPWIKHASKLGLAEKFLHFHQQWCLRRNSIPMGVWRILMDKRLMAWRRWGCRPCTERLTICIVQIHHVVSTVTKLSIGYCVLIYTQVGISRGRVWNFSLVPIQPSYRYKSISHPWGIRTTNWSALFQNSQGDQACRLWMYSRFVHDSVICMISNIGA